MTHVLVGVERSIKSVVEESREEKQMQSQGAERSSCDVGRRRSVVSGGASAGL